MVKAILFLGFIIAVYTAESSSQGFHIIRPTYRPPPRRPIIIRTAREARDGEPLWLYQGNDFPKAPATGDHPVLPKIIDDIKIDPNRRYARSVDSPSARRAGGSHTISSSTKNTGPTHPGYNRRNAREIRLPTLFDPLRPSPTFPRPFDPVFPRPGFPGSRPLPIYARTVRDIHIPGVQKPTYGDIIIPNWNPNVRTNPWQRIGGNPRHRRSADQLLDQEEHSNIDDFVDLSEY